MAGRDSVRCCPLNGRAVYCRHHFVAETVVPASFLSGHDNVAVRIDGNVNVNLTRGGHRVHHASIAEQEPRQLSVADSDGRAKRVFLQIERGGYPARCRPRLDHREHGITSFIDTVRLLPKWTTSRATSRRPASTRLGGRTRAGSLRARRGCLIVHDVTGSRSSRPSLST